MQNGGYAVYNFDTKEPGLGIPDVLLTVKASPASVALYCNPAWVTVEDENNKIAGPLNAIFQSGALQQWDCHRTPACEPLHVVWPHRIHNDNPRGVPVATAVRLKAALPDVQSLAATSATSTCRPTTRSRGRLRLASRARKTTRTSPPPTTARCRLADLFVV